eukprot:14593371-Ditylum_brightwellii.AAC.2
MRLHLKEGKKTMTQHTNLCGDKTSWDHQGWGEPGSGLYKHILSKTGIYKGGQIVMLNDVNHIRPCIYVYRHKLHPQPVGYTGGSNKVCMLMDQLKDMVIWEKPEKNVKKILTKKLAMCFGNHFSDDKPAEEACKRGFGL